MVQTDFHQAVNELSDELRQEFPQQPSVADAFRKKMEEFNEQAKLLSLPPDEVALIQDYRTWKRTPDGVGSVFHWKKRLV